MFHKSQPKSLWNNSPCCMNYVLNNTSMNVVPRFQIGSIYYKDQVDKPKKIFNEFQKPDLLLQQFRRQVLETSHPKYNTANKKKKQIFQKQKIKTRTMSLTTSSKLYEIPTKTQYKYDIHGFRAHEIGDYDVKQIQNKIKTSRKNFSFGRRIDLSKPLNFFPGPGAYETNTQKRDQMSKTCVQFRKRPHSEVQNPQTARIQLNKNKQKQKDSMVKNKQQV